MADLSVKYLGLNLRNPIVAASSGLTNSIEDIKALEKHGVGAIVLKSLFEEEIIAEMKKALAEATRPSSMYPEIWDLYDFADAEDTVTKYLGLIEDVKKEVKIPIIASVNCVSADEWPAFAKRIEAAGADALELNVFVMPSDMNNPSDVNEKLYFDVIEKVKKEVKIPVSLKISSYFSNLAQMIKKLSETGIEGITLFNRFFSPDIDIQLKKVTPSGEYSSPTDITNTLRWVGIMANRVSCDLAASTGIHDGAGVIKQLLAGANVVHIASTLYKNGMGRVGEMIKDMEEWMAENDYEAISDFRGMLSQSNTSDPAAYERAQFMKHFSGKNIH